MVSAGRRKQTPTEHLVKPDQKTHDSNYKSLHDNKLQYWSNCRLKYRQKLNCHQFFAALGPAAIQNLLAVGGAHAFAETMRLFALDIGRSL